MLSILPCDFGQAGAVHDGLDEVAELLRGEAVAFEVGGEPSVAVDDNCVQRMREHAFAVPEIHAEHLGDLPDAGQRASEEMPVAGISLPGVGILREGPAAVVLGVDSYRVWRRRG